MLRRPSNGAVIDIHSFMFGTVASRRIFVASELARRGANCAVVNNAFGRELDVKILSSCLVLAPSFYTGRTFPSYMRIAMALNNGVPIVIEDGDDDENDLFSQLLRRVGGAYIVEYDDMVQAAVDVLSSESKVRHRDSTFAVFSTLWLKWLELLGSDLWSFLQIRLSTEQLDRWEVLQFHLFSWDGSFQGLQRLLTLFQ